MFLPAGVHLDHAQVRDVGQHLLQLENNINQGLYDGPRAAFCPLPPRMYPPPPFSDANIYSSRSLFYTFNLSIYIIFLLSVSTLTIYFILSQIPPLFVFSFCQIFSPNCISHPLPYSVHYIYSWECNSRSQKEIKWNKWKPHT